jgi:hypothetical protein
VAKENGVATAEDFAQALRSDEPEPELVTLPTLKKKVLLRRPSPMWLMFNGRLPVTMAAKMARNPSDSASKAEELIESARWMYILLNKVMVKPRCVMEPTGRNEISPDMIDMTDVLFIMRWAVGEEVDEANSLNTFRDERGVAHTGAAS